jgi:hypothetical protein
MSIAQWIQVDVNFPRHPKVRDLSIEIGEERVEAYLVRIWTSTSTWTGSTGRVPGRDPKRTLEDAAGWRGPPGKLAEALVLTRWVDEKSGGLWLHDWNDYSGSWIKKAEQERERKKEWVEKKRSLCRRPVDVVSTSPIDVVSTSPVDVVSTVTGQDRTGQDNILYKDQRDPEASGEEASVACATGVSQKPSPGPDPRHKFTVDGLVRSWEAINKSKYLPFTGRDAKAVAQILAYPDATDIEIARRARNLFADPFRGKTARITTLAQEWGSWKQPREVGEKPKSAKRWDIGV